MWAAILSLCREPKSSEILLLFHCILKPFVHSHLLCGCHVVSENDAGMDITWLDWFPGNIWVMTPGEATACSAETGQEDIIHLKVR